MNRMISATEAELTDKQIRRMAKLMNDDEDNLRELFGEYCITELVVRDATFSVHCMKPNDDDEYEPTTLTLPLPLFE